MMKPSNTIAVLTSTYILDQSCWLLTGRGQHTWVLKKGIAYELATLIVPWMLYFLRASQTVTGGTNKDEKTILKMATTSEFENSCRIGLPPAGTFPIGSITGDGTQCYQQDAA